MNDVDEQDWGWGHWEVYFGLVLLATVIYVVAGAGMSLAGLTAIAVLALLVPWYLLLGRRAFRVERSGALCHAYIAGVIISAGVAAVAAGESSFVLFALCPQCFMVLTWRQSLGAVVLLLSVPAVRFLSQATGPGAVTRIALWGVVIIGSGAFFGFWIERILLQSRERRELIERLKTTQAELAEVSREAGALAERERLATEIHDTLAQGFTSILMLLRAADPHIGLDTDEPRRVSPTSASTPRRPGCTSH
jgi:signal transduction histidine kinase